MAMEYNAFYNPEEIVKDDQKLDILRNRITRNKNRIIELYGEKKAKVHFDEIEKAILDGGARGQYENSLYARLFLREMYMDNLIKRAHLNAKSMTKTSTPSSSSSSSPSSSSKITSTSDHKHKGPTKSESSAILQAMTPNITPDSKKALQVAIDQSLGFIKELNKSKTDNNKINIDTREELLKAMSKDTVLSKLIN